MPIAHDRFVRLLRLAGVIAVFVGGFWLVNQSIHVAGKAALAAATEEVPQFKFDPSYPKPLPNHWILGAIGALWIDSTDHAWVAQRPGSVKNPRALFGSQQPPHSCYP